MDHWGFVCPSSIIVTFLSEGVAKFYQRVWSCFKEGVVKESLIYVTPTHFYNPGHVAASH